MATFKVGQRVRVVKDKNYGEQFLFKRFKGAESVVAEVGRLSDPDGCYYRLAIDDGGWWFAADELAPLTDGESDSWAIDKVKQVTKPQHTEPVAPKRERVVP